MRILYITSLLFLLTVLHPTVKAENEGWGDKRDCENYKSEYHCKADDSCAYLPFVSCCGKTEFFCVNKDRKGCCDELSCGKNSEGEIFEFWSSCKPTRDFKPYIAPNSTTCEDLCCEERGMECEWQESNKCGGSPCKTHCCPREPKCVGRHNNKCDKMKCPDGYYCEEEDGEACCVPHHDGCGDIKCGWGEYCVNEHGNCRCVNKKPPPPPPQSECRNLECPKGYVCKVIKGCATCVRDKWEHHDVCKDHWCPKGTHCEANGKEACCVKDHVHPHPPPPPQTCSHINCGPGKFCKIIDGCPTCVRHEDYLCEATRCPRNYECHGISSSIVRCSPENDECRWHRCPIGQSCFNGRDGPHCIPDVNFPQLCRVTQCPRGFSCRMIRGSPTCIKARPPPPPPTCSTCRELGPLCAQIGLQCQTVPNLCANPRLPCCPVRAVCVPIPTTTTTSTTGTTAAPTTSTTGTTAPTSTTGTTAPTTSTTGTTAAPTTSTTGTTAAPTTSTTGTTAAPTTSTTGTTAAPTTTTA